MTSTEFAPLAQYGRTEDIQCFECHFEDARVTTTADLECLHGT